MKHISTLIKNTKKQSKGIRNGISMIIITAILLSVLSMAALAAPVTGIVTVPAGTTSFSIDLMVDETTTYAGIEFGLQISDESAVNFASFTPAYTGAPPSPFVFRNEWHFFGFYAASNAFSSGKVGTINFTGYTGNQELTITVKMTVTRLTSDGKGTIETETNPSHVFTVKWEEVEPPLPPVYHTVTFDPAGGTRTGGGALVQSVRHGDAAIEPIIVRSGYSGPNWDNPFDNVTSDLVVTAQWVPSGGDGPPPPPPLVSYTIIVPAGETDFSIKLWVNEAADYAGIEFAITISDPNVVLASFTPAYNAIFNAPIRKVGDRHYFGFGTSSNALPGRSVLDYVGTANFTGYTGDQPFTITIVEMVVTRIQGNYTVETLTNPMVTYTVQREEANIGDEDEPTVSAIGATVIKGNSVYVPIELINNLGLVTMRLTVTFDDRYVTLSPGSVIDGGLLGNTYHSDRYNSPYTLFWDNSTAPENLNANGTIATLKFTVDVNAPDGEYDIVLTYDYDLYDIMDCDMNPVLIKTEKAVLNVVPFVYGDLTGKGYVTCEDAELLALYLSRCEGVTIIAAAADLDQDGSITPKDLAILRRHLDGWVGYETLPYKP